MNAIFSYANISPDLVDAQDIEGNTALHLAVERSSSACVDALMRQGASMRLRNETGVLPCDVASHKIRKDMMESIAGVACRSMVLYHAKCSRHVTRDGHQESPARTEMIVERILDSKYGVREWEIIRSDSFPPASALKISSVHDSKYVNFVRQLSESAHRDAAPVAFTPRVQVGLHGTAESAAKSSENCDTFISAGSYEAATYAAGAVVAAVDAVLDGKCKNAFCAIRPPGHHSGIQGLLQNCISCGFCIFNSVAIGAAHALERGCNRVAIFDFDAHHGNGTEEIVRALPGKDKVLFISIHLEDTDHTEVEDNYTFYPASGKTSSILSRNPIINIPITPNWRCPQSEPSVAGAVAAQKASSRSRRAPSRNDDNGLGGGSSQPGDNSSGQGSAPPPPVTIHTTEPVHPSGREHWRRMVVERVLPALRAFCPDIILLSAGFDAAAKDAGNSRFIPDPLRPIIYGIDLQPWDFRWLSAQISAVAGRLDLNPNQTLWP